VSEFLWKLRCAFYFWWMARMPLRMCWYLAGVEANTERENWGGMENWLTPREAAYEELSNWTD
jgi:hypothetical protein